MSKFKASLKEVVKKSSEHGKSELTRIEYLDGWRGLAILLVLFAHFFQINQVDVGRMGVDVFFCAFWHVDGKNTLYKKNPSIDFLQKKN